MLAKATAEHLPQASVGRGCIDAHIVAIRPVHEIAVNRKDRSRSLAADRSFDSFGIARLHFTIGIARLHFTIGSTRLHFTIGRVRLVGPVKSDCQLLPSRQRSAAQRKGVQRLRVELSEAKLDLTHAELSPFAVTTALA